MRKTSASRKAAARTYKRRRYPRNRRRFSFRRILWPFVLIVLLTGIGAGCYYAFTTPKLSIESVKVVGTRLLNKKSIQADAEEVTIGKNILLLSKKNVAEEIRKGRPEIKEAKIGRVLPRTIVVRITERTPYVSATIIGGKNPSYWLVDKSGIPFHEVSKPPDSAPVVEFAPKLKLRFVAGKTMKNRAFSSAIDCLENCRSAGYKTDKISVDQVGNLCLNIGSEFYVKLGQPIDVPKKLEVLSKILARPDIGSYIDISCYERPAVGKKSGQGT